MNYNNSKSPLKKGRIQDIVQNKKKRISRVRHTSDKEVIAAMTVDLVQVLANMGIELKKVHTIARGLIRLGWIKTKKIESER